jgi:hypothetical protein
MWIFTIEWICMKTYYEVYENAIVNHPITGARVRGNTQILTTKNREKALKLYRESERTRWVEEITTDSDGCETTDIITE